jgi:anti-sigma factor RsiW
MRGHVDAESLALCAEGLLSRRRSERIRSHVASCPECAAAGAGLTEVPALLAQVPPPPLPPAIAARLDAALSAEVTRRAAEEAGTAPDHAAPARPPRPGQDRPRGPRPRLWLRMPASARGLAVAGVLVAAGGVGYAVSQSGSSPST